MARYLTTTLPYVNADPHIGFAHELLQADVLARAWRLQGEDVFFNTGSDEHGQKILQAAEKAGQEVQAYVDHYAGEFEKLKQSLSITNDAFIRTTDAKHIEAAQEMWRRCEAKGDIEKKSYSGIYCVGCEAFKTERELLEDGVHCSLHPNIQLYQTEELNYFFRLSKYQDALEKYLSQDGVVVPEWRREEALNFVRSGLEDFSISREASKLSWGVPVPGDDSQIMYVWFDALTSYISTLGWPQDTEGTFKKYWEEGKTLQVAGKDQVRFQSIMWQAMLMSADIKNTDQLFFQGFINSGGQKMSKSLGNVISPFELVEKYGTEATRYLLIKHAHPFEDSDVTWEQLDEWYTANLVNGLGNLTARIMQMAEVHLPGPVQLPEPVAISDEFKKIILRNKVDSEFRSDQILDEIAVLKVKALDERIALEQPFKKVKDNLEAGQEMITLLVQNLYSIAEILAPFMPSTSEAIKVAIQENKKPESLFPRLS